MVAEAKVQLASIEVEEVLQDAIDSGDIRALDEALKHALESGYSYSHPGVARATKEFNQKQAKVVLSHNTLSYCSSHNQNYCSMPFGCNPSSILTSD